ncbi:MAG TPA: DUF5107 domain-containing protein [Actinopolymorphaceae bacterium]
MARVLRSVRHLPVAELGPLNPLPPFADTRTFPVDLPLETFPEHMAAGMRYGLPRSIYPYLVQDGYTRRRTPGTLRTAVLQNAMLRAEFALDLGGRLWSLRDVRSGRELLLRNPVFQPANLALRNAWFSGGTEWNIGTRGHSPTTCAPLHAAVVESPDGGEALRMWEWERLRGVVFQIDAWLSAQEPALFVHVRITNPQTCDVPMYWWSNTAVPERPDLRVLTPASQAYDIGYDGTVRVIPTATAPWSYPATCPQAADYFFDLADLPAGGRPWIAAVTGDGHGLVQTSTNRLCGRKLFVWGQHRGGRRWIDWLSPSSAVGAPTEHPGAYVEIQAGLAATQYEHQRMPANTQWRWVEAYAPIDVDPGVTHTAGYHEAAAHVQRRLDDLVPRARLEDVLQKATQAIDAPPRRFLHTGSGWGALERLRAADDGEPLPDMPGTPFPVVDSAECRPWLDLLDSGELPASDPAVAPPSYVTGSAWERRLASATPNWLTAYHLATMAHARGDLPIARQHYETSLERTRSAWALRGLALLEAEAGDREAAADRLRDAHSLAPHVWQLTVETVTALRRADRAAEALAILDALPQPQRQHGRVRLSEAQTAVAAGDRDRAARLLADGIEVADIREGENALAELWKQVYPDRPLPAEYDFGMGPWSP